MKIDGVELSEGDRILIKAGPFRWRTWLKYVALRPWKIRRMLRARRSWRRAGKETGVYVVSAISWKRDA